jgi:hypothetical protein
MLISKRVELIDQQLLCHEYKSVCVCTQHLSYEPVLQQLVLCVQFLEAQMQMSGGCGRRKLLLHP